MNSKIREIRAMSLFFLSCLYIERYVVELLNFWMENWTHYFLSKFVYFAFPVFLLLFLLNCCNKFIRKYGLYRIYNFGMVMNNTNIFIP